MKVMRHIRIREDDIFIIIQLFLVIAVRAFYVCVCLSSGCEKNITNQILRFKNLK